jgi:methionyl aminopeptidase
MGEFGIMADEQAKQETICARPDCGKPAGKLQCPTCVKEGKSAKASSFCSQDCFKAFWAVHKLTHDFRTPKLLSISIS